MRLQEHIYKLMKSDSYSRFIRSSAYQELLQAKKKVQNILSHSKYCMNLFLLTRYAEMCLNHLTGREPVEQGFPSISVLPVKHGLLYES